MEEDKKYEILWDRLKVKIGKVRLWQVNQVSKKQTWITMREIMKELEKEYDEAKV